MDLIYHENGQYFFPLAYRNNSPGTPQYGNGASSPRNVGNGWQDEPNPDQLRAAAVHGTLPTDDLFRKPTRLDALPLTPLGSASKKKKKKAYNTMDQL